MTTYQCPNMCCSVLTKPYVYKKYNYHAHTPKFKNQKAGAFIVDPATRRILLVQSRGDKWGAPKGSMESTDLTIEDCAVREVREETGIDLDKRHLDRHCKINKTTYYYIELSQQVVSLDSTELEDNDATGITWIHLDCLLQLIKSGTISVNLACKKLIRKFLSCDQI